MANDIFRFLIDVISTNNKNSIGLDINDFTTVINQRQITLFSTAESYGTKAASKAVKKILEYSLLDGMYIKNVSGVMVHFYCCDTYPVADISHAMGIIYDITHEDADIIFGITVDDNLFPDCVKVTILAAN